MNRGVVVVAGGTGQRMGLEVPKQFLNLDKKPVVVHTLERFFQFDPLIRVVLVLANDHKKYWDAISTSFEYASSIKIAPGGNSRFESVKNGLQLIEDGIVLGIHDAVRPLVSYATLERCYSTAEKENSAIPVVDMDETVRRLEGNGQSTHLDRSLLKRVQTPQVFKSELIKQAYSQLNDSSYTDDASVFETKFGRVFLVEGNAENIKITTPTDLQLASTLIRTME